MQVTETIQQFYQRVRKADELSRLNNAGSGHFNAFVRENCNGTPYARRDFYKVTLMLGTGKLHYADKWVDLDKPCLLFSNPHVPYAWEPVSHEQKGYYCLFTETFIQRLELQDSPLYKTGGIPAFFVDERQCEEFAYIYRKMMEEMASDYVHKFDLARDYLHLLIHQAMKMQPVEHDEWAAVGANTRITQQFLELLERQFPIDTTET